MKTILITGASSGFGKTIGEYLQQKGYKVYGASRKIQPGGYPFHTINMDVRDDESVRTAIEKIIAAEGRIDVLVNNAGLGIVGPAENLDIADVSKILDTNFLGPLRTCQAILPYMRKQRSGLIINMSSIGSENGLPYRAAYSASKAALDRLTEALRLELAQFGIDACYVQPGGFKTNISSNRIQTILPPDSAYKESYDRCYQIIQESISQGLDPAIIGPAIEQIIETKPGRVKRCYRIGKPLEKLSVKLKGILPDQQFDKLIREHYKI